MSAQDMLLTRLESSGKVPSKEKFRRMACFTFICTGCCPYGDRCVFLHDNRISSDGSSARMTRQVKAAGVPKDTFYWPDMDRKGVALFTDDQGLPSVNQPYSVPDYFCYTSSSAHNRSLYSIWLHFIEFCTKMKEFSLIRVDRSECNVHPAFQHSSYWSNRHLPATSRLCIFIALSIQTEMGGLINVQDSNEQLARQLKRCNLLREAHDFNGSDSVAGTSQYEPHSYQQRHHPQVNTNRHVGFQPKLLPTPIPMDPYSFANSLSKSLSFDIERNTSSSSTVVDPYWNCAASNDSANTFNGTPCSPHSCSYVTMQADFNKNMTTLPTMDSLDMGDCNDFDTSHKPRTETSTEGYTDPYWSDANSQRRSSQVGYSYGPGFASDSSFDEQHYMHYSQQRRLQQQQQQQLEPICPESIAAMSGIDDYSHGATATKKYAFVPRQKWSNTSEHDLSHSVYSSDSCELEQGHDFPPVQMSQAQAQPSELLQHGTVHYNTHPSSANPTRNRHDYW